MVTFIVLLICAIVSAAIANSKGRSVVGWFFGGLLLGLIGIIIVAVLPNLKEQKAYREYTENENRRLREQLRQERLKGESFRQYSMHRLDAHDQALDIDTRSGRLLGEGNGAPPGGLLPDPADPAPPQDQPPLVETLWYYETSGNMIGPVSEADVLSLLASGAVSRNTLVWTEGFSEWLPLGQVQSFRPMGNP